MCSIQHLAHINCSVNEKQINLGKICFQEQEYEFGRSRFPTVLFPNISPQSCYEVRRFTMKWCYLHKFPRNQKVRNTSKTGHRRPWTLDSSAGGKEEMVHTFPLPHQAASPSVGVPAAVWVGAKTSGMSQIQNLQPMGSSQFAGVLGRHIPDQQKLSGAPPTREVSRVWLHR